MAKAFACPKDLSEKKITFDEVRRGSVAFTAEGDPELECVNIGDDSVMIVEAQAERPRLAISSDKGARSHLSKNRSGPCVPTGRHLSRRARVWPLRLWGAIRIISRRRPRHVEERGSGKLGHVNSSVPTSVWSHESIPGITYPTTHLKRQYERLSGKRRVDIKHIAVKHTQVMRLPRCPTRNVDVHRRPSSKTSAAIGTGILRLGQTADISKHMSRRHPHRSRRPLTAKTLLNGQLKARATFVQTRTSRTKGRHEGRHIERTQDAGAPN